MNALTKLIGLKIKAEREKRKLSPQEFATMLGIDRQYLWSIENGKENMTLNYLYNMIIILGCPLEDFYDNLINKIIITETEKAENPNQL